MKRRLLDAKRDLQQLVDRVLQGRKMHDTKAERFCPPMMSLKTYISPY